MDYKVVVMPNAEEDLDNHIQYLLYEKQNPQAALNVLSDFETTKDNLKYIANSLKLCENPKLQRLGYRRINFQKHNYFMLYRISHNEVVVDAIFHSLQDYENKTR